MLSGWCRENIIMCQIKKLTPSLVSHTHTQPFCNPLDETNFFLNAHRSTRTVSLNYSHFCHLTLKTMRNVFFEFLRCVHLSVSLLAFTKPSETMLHTIHGDILTALPCSGHRSTDQGQGNNSSLTDYSQPSSQSYFEYVTDDHQSLGGKTVPDVELIMHIHYVPLSRLTVNLGQRFMP